MEIKPYKLFFGFEKEAFRADIAADEILQTPELTGAVNRFGYAADLGAVYLITGEIGSGKSTAIRYLAGSKPAASFGIQADLCHRHNWLHSRVIPPDTGRARN